MRSVSDPQFSIRRIDPEEFSQIGQLAVQAYSSLAGMPRLDEQPEYYGRLRDVATRASNPAITVYVAIDEAGKLLGCVDFIDDMKHYASGGTANTVVDAAGVRLLAVERNARGAGIGKALTQFCIERARARQIESRVAHDSSDGCRLEDVPANGFREVSGDRFHARRA